MRYQLTGVLGALLPVLLAAAAGCDGTGTMDPSVDGGADPEVVVPAGYVGALPGSTAQYRIVRGRGPAAGQPIDPGAFFTDLASADAVCLGEEHTHSIHHAAQLLVLDRLLQQAGKRMALGMEMFQKPFQPVLDDFAAGKIDERQLLTMSEWDSRWGYPFAYYRPLMSRAVEARAPLLALNADRDITRKVSMGGGLNALTPQERAQIPELDLTNAEHRTWVINRMGSSAPSDPRLQDLRYMIQVIWDETMADTAWSWARAQGGARQVVILAGWGHCMDLAIPARMRRRGAGKVLSVRPVADGPEVAKTVAEGYNDYLTVFSP